MSYKFTSVIIQEGKWYVARCIELGVVRLMLWITFLQKNSYEKINI